MAIVTAVKSGIWSDPTVWDSGALPNPGDIVRPATFVVTIDMDVDVAELSQDTAGHTGRFEVAAAPRTIRALIRGGATMACLKLTHVAGIVTLIGDVYGKSQEALWINGVGGTLHSFGTITTLGSDYGARCDVAATIVHTGNIQGSATGPGMTLLGGVELEVYGDVIGGAGTYVRYGLGLQAPYSASCNIVVHGTARGGSLTPGMSLDFLAGQAHIDVVEASNAYSGLVGINGGTGLVLVHRARNDSTGIWAWQGAAWLDGLPGMEMWVAVEGAGLVRLVPAQTALWPPNRGNVGGSAWRS